MSAAEPQLLALIEKHWGFHTLRPLQDQAMRAVLDGRDSLVVLPTGGGKSLCYQAPALLLDGATVVVSPLISLMKDQVDSLRANGIAACQFDSSQSATERAALRSDLLVRSSRLLFTSPERLLMPQFQDFLRQLNVRRFAIDEAHCVSHWGHDFRPEYRQLGQLKQLFPDASVHAFTATATQRVRDDIAQQLRLADPLVLVGNFDRPNLTYRVQARRDLMGQVLDVLERHQGEPGIIYCIRRRDVDELTAALVAKGYKALPYHAGLTPAQRHNAQEQFADEECDLIVATVAFGMGIDRSDVRFVLHTGMPKSVEHYQQEAGRAGRDGLEAECLLLYSLQDTITWKSLVERSAGEAAGEGVKIDPTYVPAALRHVEEMDRYCRSAVCRHRVLVEYFGQAYEPPEEQGESCGACDLCLGETELVPDGTIIAQKILSAVYRTGQRFGVGHIIGVVRGQNTERIRQLRHDQLPTHGVLADETEQAVRDYVYQLIGQGVLTQEIRVSNGQEFPILTLNAASMEVLKKQREVRLTQPVRAKARQKTRAAEISWEGVDHQLFEALRQFRRDIAHQRHVPPYVIFSDATLRELARIRPRSMERLRLVYGVGEVKLNDLGPLVLPLIVDHCRARNLTTDNLVARDPTPAAPRASRPNPVRREALAMFRRGASIEEVCTQTGRARSTVLEYLCEVIRETRPADISRWVPPERYAQIATVARQDTGPFLKPIFVAFNGTISYEEIRLVVAHLQSASPA